MERRERGYGRRGAELEQHLVSTSSHALCVKGCIVKEMSSDVRARASVCRTFEAALSRSPRRAALGPLSVALSHCERGERANSEAMNSRSAGCAMQSGRAREERGSARGGVCATRRGEDERGGGGGRGKAATTGLHESATTTRPPHGRRLLAGADEEELVLAETFSTPWLLESLTRPCRRCRRRRFESSRDGPAGAIGRRLGRACRPERGR